MTPLQARLENIGIMHPEDIAILEQLQRRTRDCPAGYIVQHEQGRIEATRVILAGWAIRFRTTPDGHRQVVNFLLPGDSIGLYGALFEKSDSGVELITKATLAEFPCTELINLFRESARLGAALCCIGGQDERFLEQQIVRIGALNATSRIAHLLVELQQRMLAAGTAPADATTVPITQKLIAEALGISHVHANRCCRTLEKRGLIETNHRGLTLLDPAELKAMCGYEADLGLATHLPEASLRSLGGSTA